MLGEAGQQQSDPGALPGLYLSRHKSRRLEVSHHMPNLPASRVVWTSLAVNDVQLWLVNME